LNSTQSHAIHGAAVHAEAHDAPRELVITTSTPVCAQDDPAGDEKNNEGERRRQRVHGASVPERLGQCKARQLRDRRY
jgi:hypothetical protein